MGAFGYPVSLELAGRRCVVVGGGVVAEQKVRGLVDGGAGEVVVVAEAVTAGLEELAAASVLSVVRRVYAAGDLDGAFLAIAATDDGAVNATVYEEGTAAGVLVNSVDDIEHCAFAVPAVVRRGELTLTVATGGKAPALAKKLRRCLSAQFGPEYAALVALVGEVRLEARAQRRGVDFDAWAARWERALDDEVVALVSDGRLAEARVRLLGGLDGSRNDDEDAPGGGGARDFVNDAPSS